MDLWSGFSKKEVQGRLELEIVLAKLSKLALYMEQGEDKASDLKLWQEAMTGLYDVSVKRVDYLPQLKESYHVIYKLYLQKHHPELIIA